MEDDWESAAHRPVVIPDKINKWAGEDEEDDIKDSWEDEEEKKDEEKVEEKPKAPVKVKHNKAKLSEQERLAEEEEAKRIANMTPEEKLAEKLRIQKIQEESDLRSALETFGVDESSIPKTEEEFKKFGEAISWKLSQCKDSPHFLQFVQDLVNSICVNLPLAQLKKLKSNVDILHTEKVKLEKQNAKKPASKDKGKFSLKLGTDDIDTFKKYGDDYYGYDDGNDYDDFM
ncbi:eukaryotic translation initiation factor 3 subunit J [Musca vetustissima]|uniref:eukaryotic translation initiation factor 3 subunit J n=1 Tax=Musca vetustissima TaxID=27455 RepID=UPI002AB748F3|nr:eukaryotic translation initiation factor 3 subunit J [Musca vetustissima]